MLLKTLKVTNDRSETIEFPLANPVNGFVVKDIEGLGPVKATLVSSSFATMDGEQYHTARRESRNIVVKMGLDPDYGQMNVYDLRKQLYSYLMPKSKVVVGLGLVDKFNPNIITQKLNVEIEARVESMDPDIFTKDPTLDLSLMCYDSDFIDPTPVVFEGDTVSDLTESTLTYDGTVETGVAFKIMPDRALTDFTIYHKKPDDTLRVTYFTIPLASGDELVINSVPGDKYATLTSGGVESNVLYGVTPQSAWLELAPGDNTIRVYADGTPVPYEIEYTNKYGGL